MKQELLEWVKSFAAALVIFLIFNMFATTTTIYKTSMAPTLVENDLVLVSKIGDYSNGDIISFKSNLQVTEMDLKQVSFFKRLFVSVGDRKNLIKRIIAGPGDSVEVRDGIVILNGEVLVEPYIQVVTTKNVIYEDIPMGEYFVLGDNRRASMDSRYEEIGLVKEEDIIGKTVLRIFPFNRIGSIE